MHTRKKLCLREKRGKLFFGFLKKKNSRGRFRRAAAPCFFLQMQKMLCIFGVNFRKLLIREH